jgi:hypothetical protein
MLMLCRGLVDLLLGMNYVGFLAYGHVAFSSLFFGLVVVCVCFSCCVACITVVDCFVKKTVYNLGGQL